MCRWNRSSNEWYGIMLRADIYTVAGILSFILYPCVFFLECVRMMREHRRAITITNDFDAVERLSVVHVFPRIDLFSWFSSFSFSVCLWCFYHLSRCLCLEGMDTRYLRQHTRSTSVYSLRKHTLRQPQTKRCV